MYKLRGKKKKAFTLVETIIVCSVFAIMVVGIILGINKAFASMNNTRVKVRSTNFAREGVEMVYNIRDTNRRKCSGEKDKTWLYIGSGRDTACKYDSEKLFKPGIYILKEGKTDPDNNYYVYAEPLTFDTTLSDSFYKIDGFFDEESIITTRREKSKISFTGTYSFYSGGETAIGNIEDLLKGSGTEFYRILRVYGIYKKDTPNPKEDLSDLLGGSPAEMRFCVKIFYSNNGGKHDTELCSIMTNFME